MSKAGKRRKARKRRSWSRSELMQSIAAVARQAREVQGLTQEEVSELMGISRGQYVAIENRRYMPTLMTLGRMSVVLGVKAHVLLGFEPFDAANVVRNPASQADDQARAVRRLARLLRRSSQPTRNLALKLLDGLESQIAQARGGDPAP